jgi:diacylglycerol O-acyltransferase
MLTNYPCSIVVHGVALNITVQSYDRSLDFGLMADAKAMPDVRRLAEALEDAFTVLRTLPAGEEDDMAVATPGAAKPRSRAPATSRKRTTAVRKSAGKAKAV